MKAKKPLILVVNDDGIDAPGIRVLIHAMKELGDVVVVAPDGPQAPGTPSPLLSPFAWTKSIFIRK
jgi:5'/3'-nucleotidase SurE